MRTEWFFLMWVWSKANERKIIPKAIPKLSGPCENQAWLKTLEKTWFGLSEIGMIEDLKKNSKCLTHTFEIHFVSYYKNIVTLLSLRISCSFKPYWLIGITLASGLVQGPQANDCLNLQAHWPGVLSSLINIYPCLQPFQKYVQRGM